ncbi:MAG: biopolymer transporter ExbD [Labilithrix sp.]
MSGGTGIIGKKKGFVIKAQSAMNGEINVTPLVDVVLVLLIIFMTVTPLIERDIKVVLPSTEKVEESKDVPVEQLVVKVAVNGDIELNGAKVAMNDYVPTLTNKLKVRADKTVFIMAEDDASYARFVKVLDGARAAGATTLGMATDAPSVAQ